MTYLVVFNGRRGFSEEKISAPNWTEFMNRLYELVHHYQEAPDMIYLIDARGTKV